MKVVDDLKNENKEDLEALIITGDGRSEFRRLQPLAEYYNEDRILFLPSRTERNLSIIGSSSQHPETERRGWDALDALRLYKSNYTKFLFLIDREHCQEWGHSELEEKTKELAFNCEVCIKEIKKGAYVCKFKIGSREILLYTAVVGDKFGFIEDCLAELVKLEWGNEIKKEDKDEFKNTINNMLSGGKDRSLLENSDQSNISRAFPNLDQVLKQFESESAV